MFSRLRVRRDGEGKLRVMAYEWLSLHVTSLLSEKNLGKGAPSARHHVGL